MNETINETVREDTTVLVCDNKYLEDVTRLLEKTDEMYGIDSSLQVLEAILVFFLGSENGNSTTQIIFCDLNAL